MYTKSTLRGPENSTSDALVRADDAFSARALWWRVYRRARAKTIIPWQSRPANWRFIFSYDLHNLILVIFVCLYGRFRVPIFKRGKSKYCIDSTYMKILE